MVRPFLPHFELLNIVGYEPNADLCRTARELNPYVHFVNGGYWPPSPFADSAFDFVTAWSVFSHLPANLAAAWLSEFARICRPAARIFVTSRGERYLDALERAVDCAWSKRMIERIGDLKEARARYRAGEFLWFPETDDYGEAFIPKEAMRALLPPSMEIIAADCSLSQMTFVIQKS
jgi:ubiquinone/menaquinone biosynthesis C-methylase UbiE